MNKFERISKYVLVAALFSLVGLLVGVGMADYDNGYEQGFDDALRSVPETIEIGLNPPANYDCFSERCADELLLSFIENATRIEYSFNGTEPGGGSYYIGIYYDSGE